MLGAGCSQPSESLEVKSSPAVGSTVVCLGRVEPEGEVVRVAAPSGSNDARVAAILVSPGQIVKSGEVLARLDNLGSLAAEVLLAERELLESQERVGSLLEGAKQAEQQALRAEVARLEEEVPARIRQQQARLVSQQAEFLQVERQYKRYRQLWQQEALSRNEFEARQLEYDKARQTCLEASEELSRIGRTGQQQTRQARAKLLAAQEIQPGELALLRAGVARAEAKRALAEKRMEGGLIRAPKAGTVLRVRTQVGEKISSEGLLELADLSQMSVLAEIYQDDVTRIRPGQAAEIEADGMKLGPVQGKVSWVDSQVRRQSLVNSDPSANLDERVVEARIRFEGQSNRALAHWSGLQVRVLIH